MSIHPLIAFECVAELFKGTVQKNGEKFVLIIPKYLELKPVQKNMAHTKPFPSSPPTCCPLNML